MRGLRIAPLVLALGVLVTSRANAQERAATCVAVKAAEADREALLALVRSEVERHPLHLVAEEHCSSVLEVELIVLGQDRFVTARLGAGVPQRLHVDGPSAVALEHALEELLTIVLGNDPITLRAPGGQTRFSGMAFRLKESGRTTLDAAMLEQATWLPGRLAWHPGLLLGVSREIERVQVSTYATTFVAVSPHEHVLDLDVDVRLALAATYFSSATDDSALFAGVSVALAYQRFSGPVAPQYGTAQAGYPVLGPIVGLRAGAEVFRTTTVRAFAVAEVGVPLFRPGDDQNEVVRAWMPSASAGFGIRL